MFSLWGVEVFLHWEKVQRYSIWSTCRYVFTSRIIMCEPHRIRPVFDFKRMTLGLAVPGDVLVRTYRVVKSFQLTSLEINFLFLFILAYRSSLSGTEQTWLFSVFICELIPSSTMNRLIQRSLLSVSLTRRGATDLQQSPCGIVFIFLFFI